MCLYDTRESPFRNLNRCLLVQKFVPPRRKPLALNSGIVIATCLAGSNRRSGPCYPARQLVLYAISFAADHEP